MCSTQILVVKSFFELNFVDLENGPSRAFIGYNDFSKLLSAKAFCATIIAAFSYTYLPKLFIVYGFILQ